MLVLATRKPGRHADPAPDGRGRCTHRDLDEHASVLAASGDGTPLSAARSPSRVPTRRRPGVDRCSVRPSAPAVRIVPTTTPAPLREVSRTTTNVRAFDGALPRHLRDLITDGVNEVDLQTTGDRAVLNALVSTAASAQLHGWSGPEWRRRMVVPLPSRDRMLGAVVSSGPPAISP